MKKEDLKVTVKGSVAAVIDVIRATSSVAALFGSGVKKVTIAATLEEAYRYKRKDPGKTTLRRGERPPPGGF